MLDILPVPFLFFPLCSFTGDCSGDFNAINGIQIRQQVDDNKEMPYLIESKQSNTKSSRSTSFWFGLRKCAGRTVQNDQNRNTRHYSARAGSDFSSPIYFRGTSDQSR